jgi:phage terminase large subunit
VILREIEDDKKNRPALYKHKWLGEPNSLERRVYKDWQIIDNDIPHEARLERYGLDFGYTNDPTAVVAVYYYNGGYIFDEVLYKKGMSNKEIADTLKNMQEKLIIADCAEPKSIDELRAYGLNVMPAEKGKGSVQWGIQIVQDQRISVTKRSVNLIKEYRNYMWITDKDGRILNEPEGGLDHGLDAGRYALSTLAKAHTVDKLWEGEDKDWISATTNKSPNPAD